MLKKTLISTIMLVTLVLTASAQAPAQKNWKDRAEYDLYAEITKPDATPAARLQNLDKWKSQYAQSEYADVRLKIYLITYQQMNNHRAAFDTATEILKADPNDLTSLTEIVGYGLTLVPPGAAQLSGQNKADLDTIEKTARYIEANLDKIYGADKKPQGTTDAQWNAAKPTMEKFSQFTIARSAMMAKDGPKAETELANTVKMDPTNAQASYMLAQGLLAQQKEHPEKMPEALFEFARAATYDGPGALDAETRKKIDAFLTKAYNTYHGSAQGLDQLKAQAKAAPLPPDGLAIKSTVDIAKEQEDKRQAAAKENPMLAFWGEIKEGLTGDGSATYWDAMKDAGLPGDHNGVTKFKGKLVSTTPATKPKELTVAIAGEAADVKLVLTEPLPGMMDPGGEISFNGVAKEFSKDPYMVTFEVDPADVEGWTGKGPAPVRGAGKKGGPAPGAGATKKKQ